MSSKPDRAIWSCDISRRISCFDSCQLTITWMSNIKYVRCKSRLHASVVLIPSCMAAMLRVVVVSSSGRTRSMPLAMLTMKKELHDLFLCMRVVLFQWFLVWSYEGVKNASKYMNDHIFVLRRKIRTYD